MDLTGVLATARIVAVISYRSNPQHIASVDTGSIQLALDDFPRYHPRTAARCRSGFTDISRYGLVFTYPTTNFATLGPL